MSLPLTGRNFAIEDLRSDVAWLRSQTRRRIGMKANRSQVGELEAEVDRLTLYVATLFRILVVEKVVSAEDLRNLLVRIDAEDGQVDGAYRGRDLVSGEERPEPANPFASLDQ